jgi:hypothetical protein
MNSKPPVKNQDLMKQLLVNTDDVSAAVRLLADSLDEEEKRIRNE